MDSGSEFSGLKTTVFGHFWAVSGAYKRHTPLHIGLLSPQIWTDLRGVKNPWKIGGNPPIGGKESTLSFCSNTLGFHTIEYLLILFSQAFAVLLFLIPCNNFGQWCQCHDHSLICISLMAPLNSRTISNTPQIQIPNTLDIRGLANGISLKPSYIPFLQRVHLNVYTCVQMFSLTNTTDVSQG